jgi:hypothetical protein
MPISPAVLIDDDVSPVFEVSTPVIATSYPNIRKHIIRCFSNLIDISVHSNYSTEINVISENKSTFAFTIGNVKFININNLRYNVESDTVERGSFGNGIVQNGNTIDVIREAGTYRIDFSNKSAITFSNVNISAGALAKMI